MGTLTCDGSEYAVSGRIDRLAVTDDRVLILDYKTNRPAAASAGRRSARPIVPQLALYRALLAPLYPGRRSSAALLSTPRRRGLIALPPDGAWTTRLPELTQA